MMASEKTGDLLVRLYDLPESPAMARVAAAGIDIRRALPPERHMIVEWILQRFSPYWAGEAEIALSQLPTTIWLAVKDRQLLGFACHDASAKGFFGPTGVDESTRGQGVGEALLFATLAGMREAGYGYAVIGDPGPVEFYQKRLDVMPIPGSTPGIYRGMLRPHKD
jgi:GNAT superfamily N-acetyltransferase